MAAKAKDRTTPDVGRRAYVINQTAPTMGDRRTKRRRDRGAARRAAIRDARSW